ncbi:MAG: N-acetyl-gamma-glutamyl-phosphate reductase [Armatimonadetes bacterium]|nr:N-acetyl-gamma-glutamyl-phosphate reductase [Armatimonadota bacterium]NIM23396.1 N-acetyl-gamma-glutamyl-phosphate reductase [Armatimonadota bacterium]NIM67261.1 N-acetyl-gamma-glutamyl-phosphate reductase [Armatimonadota bacterium]NIM75759.1 N-acetyl-gamma-glutamyl-phosphate reductase [Armatimonadota bacterium]NIN05447.1 N-acetyl-gamma-glutamyl-phosphate reductase [Armatimonadota bacterium]
MPKALLDKVTVAIGGATGYGGVELIRLLSRHPGVRVTYLASASSAGKRLEEVYPHLAEYGSPETLDSRLQALEPKAMAEAAQVVMFALPAGKSAAIVPALLKADVKVIDGGPDFRLHDPAAYPRWYKFDHPAPELLKEAVYGLPELHGEKISTASLVAAPGCYPTGALLAIAPVLKSGLIKPQIIVDSKSGISGAGRTALSLPYHFTEATEDVSAYGLPAHRHLPEMQQEASLLHSGGKSETAITFTPHLMPMVRGIFTTAYADLAEPATDNSELSTLNSQLTDCMKQFYAGSPFVHVSEQLPHTKWTAGTNHAFLSARVSADGSKAILFSVIDNLVKGLAGQMVQCLNLMCGFSETAGLEGRAVYP